MLCIGKMLIEKRALASLVVTVMPISAALMGWRGAGGTGMAFM